MTRKRKNKLLDNRIFWLVVSLIASLLIWMYLTGTQQEEIEVELNGVQVVFEGEDVLQDTREYIIANVDNYFVDVTIRGTRVNIGLALRFGRAGRHRRFRHLQDGIQQPHVHAALP